MSGEVELSEVSPEINDGKPIEEPNPDFSDKFQMAIIFDAGTKDGGLLGTKLTPEQADKYVPCSINCFALPPQAFYSSWGPRSLGEQLAASCPHPQE